MEGKAARSVLIGDSKLQRGLAPDRSEHSDGRNAPGQERKGVATAIRASALSDSGQAAVGRSAQVLLQQTNRQRHEDGHDGHRPAVRDGKALVQIALVSASWIATNSGVNATAITANAATCHSLGRRDSWSGDESRGPIVTRPGPAASRVCARVLSAQR